MDVTSSAYLDQLKALLPRGRLWVVAAGSILEQLLQAIANTLLWAHQCISSLLVEADPRSTSQLLPEWEAVTGLPDGCIPGGGSTVQRRNAMLARLAAIGGQSAAYFVGLAAQYGYVVTIDYPAASTMRVSTASTVAITTFQCGRSRSGDPLRAWGNQQLECLLTRAKPADAAIQFAYGV